MVKTMTTGNHILAKRIKTTCSHQVNLSQVLHFAKNTTERIVLLVAKKQVYILLKLILESLLSYFCLKSQIIIHWTIPKYFLCTDTVLPPEDILWMILSALQLTEIERHGRHSIKSPKTRCVGSHPDLHVGPLAQPLLPRFGGRELRHFFAVQLQDTWVLMPHDLRGGGDTSCHLLGFSSSWPLTSTLPTSTTNNPTVCFCFFHFLPSYFTLIFFLTSWNCKVGEWGMGFKWCIFLTCLRRKDTTSVDSQ